jgi:hypothetical protein
MRERETKGAIAARTRYALGACPKCGRHEGRAVASRPGAGESVIRCRRDDTTWIARRPYPWGSR